MLENIFDLQLETTDLSMTKDNSTDTSVMTQKASTNGDCKDLGKSGIFKVQKFNLDDLEEPLGQGDNIHKMKVMIQMFKNPGLLTDPQSKNASLVRTALLVGLPGNGKTLLAKYFSVL